METLRLEKPELQHPHILSPCSSGRRRSGDSNSPEFEFWMVRNPSLPPPNLLSADQLFVDGVILPLHLLHHHENSDDPPDPPPNPEPASTNSDPKSDTEPGSGPELSSSALPDPSVTASKRWKDIFKKGDRKSSSGGNNGNEDKEREKEKKRERKSGGGGNGATSAELNINIWPFSRSRSAGNGGSRPRMVAGSAAAATRKVSSAPCSRSNSAGESKSRKWPSSPSRGGVHLGRSSPVWQVRRGGGSGIRSSDPMIRNVEKGLKKEGNLNESRRSKPAAVGGGGGGGAGAKARVLTLNVPMCIGYRHHMSCRSEQNSAVGVAVPGGGGVQSSGGGSSGEGGRGSNLFNLRGLFTKKVY